MARIFPLAITATDVASLLATLASATPSTDDGWASACVDFDAPRLIVSVAWKRCEYDAAARRDIEEAITLLPQFHAWVREAHHPLGSNDGSEDHDLGAVEIDDGEVYLDYCARRYNSTWGYLFRKDTAGHWRPPGESAD